MLARDLLGRQLEIAGLAPSRDVTTIGRSSRNGGLAGTPPTMLKLGVAMSEEAEKRLLTNRRAMVAVRSAPATAPTLPSKTRAI